MTPERHINPEMIVLAREARGVTQRELADALRIAQGTLSKYENGLSVAPEALLDGLAKALRFPRDFFVATDSVYGPSASEFYHRKRASAAAGAMKEVYATLNIIRMNVAKLLRSAELDATFEVPRHDPDKFGGDASEIARAVRAAWQLPAGPVKDVIGTLEEAGIMVIRVPFPTRHLDAIGWWFPGMPPLIFLNRGIPADKERFSCCHELGHLVMHKAVNESMEQQANEFAAEFLMPEADIRPQLARADTLMRFGELKLYWKVAMQALFRRARDLGCVGDGRYRYLQMEMSRRGYRMREPAEYDFPKEEPVALQDLLDLHVTEFGYTLDELTTHLCVSREDVAEWYGRSDKLRLIS